uniref:Coiled-coil domain containing 148 n=1 Tax=Cyprinodon variegatus TaxID=28743 RepID=A0A3Q2GAU8_CYPVA
FVRDQQMDIIAKLKAEYQHTEEQITDLGLEVCLILAVSEIIPEELLNADCPYPDLKDSLIHAFESLSERYKVRLQSLKEQLEKNDRLDHERFQFTVSMYTHDIPNYRALCMDMLLRQFPDRTTFELVSFFCHERLWDMQRFTRMQLRVVTQQWHRDQQELLERALFTLQEAEHAHQEELEHHKDRQHQQNICLELREKVSQWRAQQEEVAKLEAAIAARRQEEVEERLKREQEKEASIRSQQKEKVWTLSIFVVPQKCQLLPFAITKVEQKVEVQAEADPERMMADTEAWRNRCLNQREFELQRPLYSINTYTDKQIVSDPRVRAEQAFRKAGVHQNLYAKEILSQIKPLKMPRKDTKSTLKF